MKIAFFCLIICLMISCTSNNNTTKEKELSIKDLGEIRFRRSYAGFENWPESKIDSVTKSNPNLDNIDSSATEVFKGLNNAGFVVNNRLLIDKLSESLQDSLVFIDADKNTIVVKTGRDITLDSRIIEVSKAEKKVRLAFKAHGLEELKLLKIKMPDRSWCFLTFDPWYFMNGDMYSLEIFKVK